MGDHSGQKAWRAMLLAHRAALRAIDVELERLGGIPLTWYDILLELNAADDRRLRMCELADRVVLSRTRVSRLVDEMASERLVVKTRDEGDRRVVWANLTEKGRLDFQSTAPLYLNGIKKCFASHLTTQEAAVIATALGRVHAAHSEVIGTLEGLESPLKGRLKPTTCGRVKGERDAPG